VKFSKIKINVRIVINAFQVRICSNQHILDDLQTTIIVLLRRHLQVVSSTHQLHEQRKDAVYSLLSMREQICKYVTLGRALIPRFMPQSAI